LALGFACVDADIPNVSNDLRDALAENFASAGAAGANASGSGGSASTPIAGAGGEGGAAGNGGEPGEPETDGGVGGSSMAGVAGSEGGGAGGTGPGTGGCDGFEVLQQHCANASCHGAANAPFGGFASSPDAARDYIDVESNAACANQGAIVNTDDPAASLLVTKVTGEADCGSPMPIGGEPLSDEEIACLEDWIAGF
jgi:hypothetical protein